MVKMVKQYMSMNLLYFKGCIIVTFSYGNPVPYIDRVRLKHDIIKRPQVITLFDPFTFIRSTAQEPSIFKGKCNVPLFND